jgi:hypothetical protein
MTMGQRLGDARTRGSPLDSIASARKRSANQRPAPDGRDERAKPNRAATPRAIRMPGRPAGISEARAAATAPIVAPPDWKRVGAPGRPTGLHADTRPSRPSDAAKSGARTGNDRATDTTPACAAAPAKRR